MAKKQVNNKAGVKKATQTKKKKAAPKPKAVQNSLILQNDMSSLYFIFV